MYIEKKNSSVMIPLKTIKNCYSKGVVFYWSARGPGSESGPLIGQEALVVTPYLGCCYSVCCQPETMAYSRSHFLRLFKNPTRILGFSNVRNISGNLILLSDNEINATRLVLIFLKFYINCTLDLLNSEVQGGNNR